MTCRQSLTCGVSCLPPRASLQNPQTGPQLPQREVLKLGELEAIGEFKPQLPCPDHDVLGTSSAGPCPQGAQLTRPEEGTFSFTTCQLCWDLPGHGVHLVFEKEEAGGTGGGAAGKEKFMRVHVHKAGPLYQQIIPLSAGLIHPWQAQVVDGKLVSLRPENGQE